MLRLADAISDNTLLKDLNLSTNQLTHLSMEDFATSLQKNSSVTSLNLAENAIGSEGAAKLAKAFSGPLR
jgi:Ran GTPase-activating protein (RanGAP) involved in mRNA processing and transport